MKIEEQVCSLELAKKLQSLGVPQKSYFWWDNTRIESASHIYEYYDCDPEDMIGFYSAFTVAELGEMLPETIMDSGREYYLRLRKGIFWHVSYSDFFSQKSFANFEVKTISNAMAKMLIYLIENGYVKAGEL